MHSDPKRLSALRRFSVHLMSTRVLSLRKFVSALRFSLSDLLRSYFLPQLSCRLLPRRYFFMSAVLLPLMFVSVYLYDLRSGSVP